MQGSTHRDGEADAGGSKASLTHFMALCFDDVHLPPSALAEVKEAAEQFLKTSLAPGDQAVVVTTSHSSKSVFTSDVPTLVEEIAQITSVPQPASYTSHSCIRLSPYEAYQIVDHMDPGDAVLNAKIAQCLALRRAATRHTDNGSHQAVVFGAFAAV